MENVPNPSNSQQSGTGHIRGDVVDSVVETMLECWINNPAEVERALVSPAYGHLTPAEQAAVIGRFPVPMRDPAPCPQWCVTDHTRIHDDWYRECDAAPVTFFDNANGDAEVQVFRLCDLRTGEILDPEVRVGDATVTPVEARKVAAAILNAADVAEGGVR